jgi:hypothetical protein
MAPVSLSSEAEYQRGYGPLLDGFRKVDFGDVDDAMISALFGSIPLTSYAQRRAAFKAVSTASAPVFHQKQNTNVVMVRY